MHYRIGARWITAIIYLLIVIWGKGVSAEILLGYGSHFDAPYAVVEDDELVGGWVLLTADALADVLRKPVATVAIPHKRSSTMVSRGDVDLYCFTNPAWVRDMRNISWSEKLFDVSNLVITQADMAKSIRSPYDMRGFFVGTILGYNYRSLTPFFDHGQIRRVDTKSYEQNLKMLRNGRVEAVVLPDTVAEKLLVRMGMEKDFRAAPFVISNRSLHCAISSVNRKTRDRLKLAMQRLKHAGLFDWPELAAR